MIVVQRLQPPLDGVSPGASGYGLCAYASSFACAACIPAIHASGETPPVDARGAVTPPATCDCGLTRWIAAYAGFSSVCVYTFGDVGRSQRRWFGSFQTVHRWTNEYRDAAVRANAANVVFDVGAQFSLCPPFAHRGVP